MKEKFIENYCGGCKNILEEDLNFIDKVFQKSMIETCYVNLPENELFKGFNRETYTKYVKSTLFDLACRAGRDVISQSNFSCEDITHIVFGTMTSTIYAPTLDVLIMQELNLNLNTKRLNVEAMGCITGFRLTGLCRDIALQDEHNVVLLLVCDVRSALGNQLIPHKAGQPIEKQNVIVSALFRDSGGAAIFSQNKSGVSVIDHRSYLLPDSYDFALLQEYDNGYIHLYLDKQLPVCVFQHVPLLVTELLIEYQLKKESCLFAVHTGGPKIIRGIQQCLELKEEQLCASWYVMKNYGNLSGSSNLVVMHHIERMHNCTFNQSILTDEIVMPKDFSIYTYVVGLSFGPGIAVECVLFQF
ncbi:unnamed protein product [Didymodactylos carnosus]|uniref:Uncharacterized protein n=2 Tax=Didymodactylos carnosus TaxID=1234261 RepID=A0A8S2F2P6_9BILA|nr:unnamed protein product [Didymodactylos carnosus]CAF4134103.1 unnamed protein product [Didymodactylos carnosus]